MSLAGTCDRCGAHESCATATHKQLATHWPTNPSAVDVFVVFPELDYAAVATGQLGGGEVWGQVWDAFRKAGFTDEEMAERWAWGVLPRCPVELDSKQKRMCADITKHDILASRAKCVVLLDWNGWQLLDKKRNAGDVVGHVITLPEVRFHQKEVEPRSVTVDGLNILTLPDLRQILRAPDDFEPALLDHHAKKIRGVLDGTYPPRRFDPATQRAAPDWFKGKRYRLVETAAEAIDVFKRFAALPAYAYDIETAPKGYALDPYSEHFKIIGVSLSAEMDTGFFIPLRHHENPLLDQPGVREALVECLTSPSERVAHNGCGFDAPAFAIKERIPVVTGWDTQIADVCINENRQHKLYELAERYTNMGWYEDELEAAFGRKKKSDRDYERDVPLAVLARYACGDADATWQLRHAQEPILRSLPSQDRFPSQLEFFREHLMLLGLEVAQSEQHGMALHPEEVELIREEMHAAWKEAETKCFFDPVIGRYKQIRASELEAAGRHYLDNADRIHASYAAAAAGHPPLYDFVNGTEGYVGAYAKLKDLGVIPKRKSKTPWATTKVYREKDIHPSLSSSSKAVPMILTDQRLLDLPVLATTPTGKPKTDKKVLLEWAAGGCSWVQYLMDWRALDKQWKTYVQPVVHGDFKTTNAKGQEETRRGWIRDDGLVHTRIIIAGADRGGGTEDAAGGTKTGRPSAKDPNLLNVAKRTSWGKRIYRMFTSRYHDPRYPFAVDEAHAQYIWENMPPKWKAAVVSFVFPGQPGAGVIMQLDYSQLELRLFAILTHCVWMLKRYAEGADLHAELAMEIFGKTLEEVKANGGFYRALAKEFWFGPIYGEGVKGMWEQLIEKGGEMSIEEVQALYDRVMQRLVEFDGFKEAVFRQLDDEQCVYIASGRRRFMPQYLSSENYIRAKAKRQAVNSLIQGLGADCTNYSWITAGGWLREHDPWTKIVLSVYDSLLLDTTSDRVPYIARMVERIMMNVPWAVIKNAQIPLKVDCEAGPSWGFLEEYEPPAASLVLGADGEPHGLAWAVRK